MDARVAAELKAIVGPNGMVDSEALLFAYEADGLAMQRQGPDLALLPRTTAQVAACMRVLHREKIPVVGRGAGTGLSGGATPVAGGVVLGTARMRDVLELNAEERWARVQAGVVNVELTRACSENGLLYAPDPSSQQACTIGGNVAENSGGPHCFKYGATTRHVLGLMIVRADGSMLELSEPTIDPVGFDLVGLFVGCEGMFGIATEITVALTPAPAAIETLLAIFRSLDDACDSVSDIIAQGHEPSALEILDKLTIQAVEDSVFAAGYPREAEAVLLVDVEGSQVEVETTVRDVLLVLEQRRALEVRRATGADERKSLWAGRKGAFGAMGRIAPDLYVADVVVPRTKLRELVRGTIEICRAKGLKLSNVFHAGDGNLHPNISYDRRDPEQVQRVLAAGEQIMALCIEAGGSLTGEHGVGLEKLASMERLFTPEDLRTMCNVRDVWDPDRRMNPGKVIPIRACREMRGAERPR